MLRSWKWNVLSVTVQLVAAACYLYFPSLDFLVPTTFEKSNSGSDLIMINFFGNVNANCAQLQCNVNWPAWFSVLSFCPDKLAPLTVYICPAAHWFSLENDELKKMSNWKTDQLKKMTSWKNVQLKKNDQLKKMTSWKKTSWKKWCTLPLSRFSLSTSVPSCSAKMIQPLLQ